MKKVLLILFGGRIIPNVLTILHLEPDIIVPIVPILPKDQTEDLDAFKKSVNKWLLEEKKSKCVWFDDNNPGTPNKVNPYDKEDVRKACNNIVQKVQDKLQEQKKQEQEEQEQEEIEWIFNITSGTSTMSIGAYEAAKELLVQRKTVKCWYLNTAKTRIETLVGEEEGASFNKKLFTISIKDYAAVHNKVLTTNKQEDELPSEERRLEFANFLISSQDYIKVLSEMLTRPDDNNNSVEYQMRHRSSELDPCTRSFSGKQNEFFVKAVLKKAHEYGLIRIIRKMDMKWSFEISWQQFHFLNGGWLELYVCHKVSNIREEDGKPLFEDIQRNRFVHNKTEEGFHKQYENELDVSMIYNAQLFIIECKAGKDVKDAKTIFTLDSVANAFGGGFVGKYLVAGLSKEEIKNLVPGKEEIKNQEYENFQKRLRARRIKLITWEDLRDLDRIFRQEAKEPDYPRI